jgi:hypothetical protein
MVAVHAGIGLGEAAIASLVVAAIVRLRPDVLGRPPEGRAGWGSVATLGLAVSLGLALFLSPFACRWPDGLERVAARVGIEPSRMLLSPAPLRDYVLPRAGGSPLSTALAVAAGTLLVFGLSVALGTWLATSGGSVPRDPSVPGRSATRS